MEQLFLEVVNMSIIASVIILCVVILRMFLKKVPTIFSYMLWGIVFFRLLCPVSFESTIGIFPSTIVSVVEDSILGGTMSEQQELSNQSIVHQAIQLKDHTSIVEKTNITNAVEEVIPSAIILWIIGMVSIWGYSLIQYVRLKRTLIGATPLEKGIYLVDYMKTPFVMGVICPSIYLPAGLTSIEQEYIIAHEKIHIARFDYITRVLAFIALIIHWFNPLVWVAYFLSEKDMELSCDEAVIKTLNKNEQLPYAKILLQMATGRKLGLITPLAFGEGNPKDRIRNIMKYKKPTMWVSVVMLSIICIFTIVLGSNRKENKIETLAVQESNESENIQENIDKNQVSVVENQAKFPQAELTHTLVATNARIENKTHLEQFDCVKVVVNQQNLDLTHDGIDDYIETVFYVPKVDAEHINIEQVDPNKLFDGGNGCYVAIYDGNDTEDWNGLGTLLWEKSYYGVHAGNGQINVVTYEGKTYLFATNLYAAQGDYDLSYEIFALESDGTYHILAEDSLQISTREPNHSSEDAYLLLEEEKQEILLFQEHMQQWIDAAKVLVITDIAMVEQLVSTLEKEYMSYPYYASIFQYYINDMIGTISGEEILTE